MLLKVFLCAILLAIPDVLAQGSGDEDADDDDTTELAGFDALNEGADQFPSLQSMEVELDAFVREYLEKLKDLKAQHKNFNDKVEKMREMIGDLNDEKKEKDDKLEELKNQEADLEKELADLKKAQDNAALQNSIANSGGGTVAKREMVAVRAVGSGNGADDDEKDTAVDVEVAGFAGLNDGMDRFPSLATMQVDLDSFVQEYLDKLRDLKDQRTILEDKVGKMQGVIGVQSSQKQEKEASLAALVSEGEQLEQQLADFKTAQDNAQLQSSIASSQNQAGTVKREMTEAMVEKMVVKAANKRIAESGNKMGKQERKQWENVLKRFLAEASKKQK